MSTPHLQNENLKNKKIFIFSQFVPPLNCDTAFLSPHSNWGRVSQALTLVSSGGSPLKVLLANTVPILQCHQSASHNGDSFQSEQDNYHPFMLVKEPEA
jgi:hypothetical protein